MAGAIVKDLADSLRRQAKPQVRFVPRLSTGLSLRGLLDDGLGSVGRVGRGRQGGIRGVAANEFTELAYFIPKRVEFLAQLLNECVAFSTSWQSMSFMTSTYDRQ
jgi:hypothetical protein